MRKIRHHLPAPETTLLGREEEIAAWKELLLTPSTRLLTLTGFGGLGKTRAALELAWRCVREDASEFPQGVWWVAAEETRTVAELLQSISAALGLAPSSGTDPRAHLFEYLEARRLLLVLDNLEQVTDAGKFVGDLLRAASGVRVLAASRRTLGIAAEQRREVAPLACPPEGRHLTSEEARSFPAVALFHDRAKARDESFTLDPEEIDEVSELCRRLDGVPLAIELAAARVGSRSPSEMLERLSDRFKLLQTKSPDQPERHRALRGAIEWSYDLLSEDSQQLFAQLAVFHRGFLLPHAEAICDGDDVEDLVEELQQQSFLRTLPDLIPKRKRFTMLESLREFAVDELRESDDREVLHEAHARHFAAIAEKALTKLRTADEALALREIQADLPNLESAFEWSRSSGPPLLTARLGAALGRYYERRGFGRRALERLDVAKDAWEAAGDAPQSLLAGIHRSQAGAWLDCRDAARADDYAARALIVANAMGSPHAQAEAWNLRGGAAGRRGDAQRAEECFARALELYRAAGDETGAGMVLNNRALLGLEKGEATEETVQLLLEARAIRERAQDHAALAETLGNLGFAYYLRSNLEEAQRYYAEALAIDQKLDNPLGIAFGLYNLGEIAYWQSRWEDALRLSIAAERLFDNVGSPHVRDAREQAGLAAESLADGASQLQAARAQANPLTSSALAGWALRE